MGCDRSTIIPLSQNSPTRQASSSSSAVHTVSVCTLVRTQKGNGLGEGMDWGSHFAQSEFAFDCGIRILVSVSVCMYVCVCVLIHACMYVFLY